MVINQTLISIKDDYIRQRYFDYMKKNKIEIVSDIFERMDLDRKFRDELRRVQNEQEKKGHTVENLKDFIREKKICLKQLS
jgi:hypothetical protein